MGHYTYYDRDFFTNSGCWPLTGYHYKDLLQCCFEHTAYVAFLQLEPLHPFTEKLKKWKVNDFSAALAGLPNADELCICVACDELQQAMLSWTDDLFSFYTSMEHKFPEDPMFIREDGTIFFDSIIHEGECSLYPRVGENIDSVLSWGRWLYFNDNWDVEVPATEHQYPFPKYAEVQEDTLYKELSMIQSNPDAYLDDRTVDAICAYVNNYCPPYLKNAKKLPSDFSHLPTWYFAFEMYVLGECDALTSTKIPTAFAEKGIKGIKGFHKYFGLLTKYMHLISKQTTRKG